MLPMAPIYERLIKAGLRTIDQVEPENLRIQVQTLLKSESK